MGSRPRLRPSRSQDRRRPSLDAQPLPLPSQFGPHGELGSGYGVGSGAGLSWMPPTPGGQPTPPFTREPTVQRAGGCLVAVVGTFDGCSVTRCLPAGCRGNASGGMRLRRRSCPRGCHRTRPVGGPRLARSRRSHPRGGALAPGKPYGWAFLRRGDGAARTVRAERARHAPGTGRLRPLPPDPEPDPGPPPRGGAGVRADRWRHQRGDHRGDRGPQRRSGLPQRVPGGGGDGLPPGQDPPGGRGHEGRPGEPGPGDRPSSPATWCRSVSAPSCRPTSAC